MPVPATPGVATPQGGVGARALVVAGALTLLGCGALFPRPGTVSGADAAPGGDGVVADSGGVDADTASGDAGFADAATDAADGVGGSDLGATDAGPTCACPDGLVRLVGACVPTPQLGCGPSCVGKAPSACPAQSLCDEAAAVQPCSDIPAAACVPQTAMAFASGSLRVVPDQIAVGKKATLLVQGGWFYVGALMWWAKVSDVALEAIEWEQNCTLRVAWTPKEPGVVPVAVTYAGGPNEGAQGWQLAGFVRVGDGTLLAQPGTACGVDADCQSGGGWSCGCTAGRCGCAAAK